MDAMVEIEQASEAGQNLAQVVGRFNVWRASRNAGGRIPAELWAVAVDMAKVHGLNRMSKELRLDCSGLKRRLEGAGGDVQPGRRSLRCNSCTSAHGLRSTLPPRARSPLRSCA